jgi:protease-4
MIQQLTNLLSYRMWAFEQGFAERIVPVILHQLSKGESSLTSMKEEAKKKMAVRYNGLNAEVNYDSACPYYIVKASNGSRVAILPVIGSLTKRGEMCSYGMRDYSSTIQSINEDDSIAAIVLDSESPGGTVDGTPEFGIAVKNSKKPIGVFGDSMLASAGMWFASQARFIMGNANNPTEFGSIGTLYMHVYAGEWIKKNVGEIQIIRAPQSTEKALVNELEPLPKDQYKAIVSDLEQCTEQFISTVKAGRGDRLNVKAEGLFTGRMFPTDEAIEIGLIDYKGDLMDAVNKAASLVGTAPTQSQSTQSKNSNMSLKNAFNKIVGKKAKAAAKPAAAEEAAAAEPQGVEWSEELVFNTDGSGDGSICNHPDADGNVRSFETKIDNNTGNEPPTDPAITEDDNWLLIPAAEEEAGDEGEGAEATAIGKANAQITSLTKQVAELTAASKKSANVVASLKRQLAEAKAAASNTAAASPTQVVKKADKGNEYAGKKPVQSWEKKAARKLGQQIEE